jgi:hypothetical protein
MKAFFGKIADWFRGLADKYRNLGYMAKKKVKFIIGRVFLYFVLIELAYLFILPFIYIFTTSMMSFQDYMDPTVKWIPTSIYWKNYSDAFKALSYFGMFKGDSGEKVFMSSFLIPASPPSAARSCRACPAPLSVTRLAASSSKAAT